jgi:proteasome lid subunit RPN8/RPN11
VPSHLLSATESALVTFRGPEGPHEGIVFWGGREMEGITLFTTAVTPRAVHTRGSVQCDEAAIRGVVHALRPHGLGLLAQVHSHPGGDARHSDGDDVMILLPFEGMLSIVVPWYGRDGMHPLSSCGIHQFQEGRWVLCDSNLDGIQVVPGRVDLR